MMLRSEGYTYHQHGEMSGWGPRGHSGSIWPLKSVVKGLICWLLVVGCCGGGFALPENALGN